MKMNVVGLVHDLDCVSVVGVVAAVVVEHKHHYNCPEEMTVEQFPFECSDYLKSRFFVRRFKRISTTIQSTVDGNRHGKQEGSMRQSIYILIGII